MRPDIKLTFIGGCEFAFILETLRANPEQFFSLDCFYTYEKMGQTDAYLMLSEHLESLLNTRPDAFVISQFDILCKQVSLIQSNQAKSRTEQDEYLKEIIRQCEEMIRWLSTAGVPIVLQFFPWPRTKMIHRYKHDGSTYTDAQFLRKYIQAMEDLSAHYDNFYFMDLSDVCSYWGYQNTLKLQDPPWYAHLSRQGAELIAGEFTRWINHILRRSRKIKCVLVDLDNTMWNGVIRDVGFDGIEVRKSVERFRWNVLRILAARGILIGAVSKNDPYLEESIRKYTGDLIVGWQWVCMELSWNDKWQVVQEVSEQLNIGLDSILFVDDNEFERSQMQAMLPEVRVADEKIFPELLYVPELHPEHISTESSNRTTMYIQESHRRKAAQTMSREAFLHQCQYQIQFSRMQPEDIARVTELINRTNQLNTSIKRYRLEEVKQFDADPDFDIFVIRVKDKFGDYGLVGVCIGKKENPVYTIDTLLFSCRVMSRGVEDYMLSKILHHAHQQNCQQVKMVFNKGPKNAGMCEILKNNGFQCITEISDQIELVFDLIRNPIKKAPAWLTSVDSIETVPASIT